MPLILSIRSNVNQVTRDLDRLERQQIPFAMATAVNSLSNLIRTAEVKAIEKTFPTATPFTTGGVKVKRARKSDPTATVFMGSITEAYLVPYITGGRHFLGAKKGILNPKNVQLNQYGNLAKNKLAALKSKSDVFIGQIKTKNGEIIRGVFQRGNFVKRTKSKTLAGRKIKGITQRHRLKILIRFTDPMEVRQHLPWFETAAGILNSNAAAEMDKAMKFALATAKP